jgi:hypothetical protein
MKIMIRRPAKNQTPNDAANPKIIDRVRLAGVQWKSEYFLCVIAPIISTS